MIGRLRQPGERYRKRTRNLATIKLKRVRPGNVSNNWSNTKPANAVVRPKLAEHIDILWLQSYFFKCLTLGGVLQVDIFGLAFSASKGDLTAMVIALVSGTTNVQQVPGTLLPHQRRQNGGIHIVLGIVNIWRIRSGFGGRIDSNRYVAQ